MKGNIVIEDDVLIDENSVLNGHITISRGSSLFKNSELIRKYKYREILLHSKKCNISSKIPLCK